MVTDVDADVIDLAAVDAEEHQVAALELAALHRLGCVCLLVRGARHVESEMPMRVEHQAAAVEAIDGGAAIAIARTTKTEREIRECIAAIAHPRRATAAIPGFSAGFAGRRRGLQLGGRATAGDQQKNGDIPHCRRHIFPPRAARGRLRETWL